MSQKRRIRAHYEPRIRPERANYDVLDWANAKSQEARFAVLVGNVELSGKTLLDLGCGLGDLWAYLNRRRIDVEYTGVDILAEMVAAAAIRNRGARFLCGDVFGSPPFDPGRFDVVFCSGALNLNLGNNMEFLPRAMDGMLQIARETVVFNLLHARAAFRDDRYFSHEPGDVLKAIASKPCSAEVLDDYLPNDFTVICRKTAEPPAP